MKSSIQRRKMTALTLLEKQLEKGTKPVKAGDYEITTEKGEIIHVGKPAKRDEKGNLVYETLKDGSKKLVLLDIIPLMPWEIKKKQEEVASLKRKLKIA